MTDTTKKKVKPRGPSYFIEDIGSSDAYYWLKDILVGSPIDSSSIGGGTRERAAAGEMQCCHFRISAKHFKYKIGPLLEKRAAEAGMMVPNIPTLFYTEVKIGIKRTKADIEYDKYDQS